MTRLPMTLSAMALILSLAACGGGGGGGSIASTPLNNGGGSDAGEDTDAGSNTNNGGNQGSDADKDGDVLTGGGRDDNMDAGETNDTDEKPDSNPASEAVPTLAGFIAKNDGSENFKIDVKATIKKDAGAALSERAHRIVTEDGAILIQSDFSTDHQEIVRIEQDDVEAIDVNGIATFKGENSFGKLSVPGKGLKHTVFGYWALENADNDHLLDDMGTIWGGEKTLAGSMPTSGEATYKGRAVAVEYGSDKPHEMSGVLSATANFDRKVMKLTADMTMRTAKGEWGTISTIKNGIPIGDASSFAGGFTSTNGHSGFGKGQFNGQDAAEIVGNFGIGNGTSQVWGAFGGKKQ